ncbi:MAG: SOS response-associated peptidase [Elusimicrobia bacterium]|nr:SOS response-associated peptidase [Elusimicrobiota bacterium]
MCGRYAVGADPVKTAARFGVAPAPGLKSRWNVAPSQQAPVLILSPAKRMAMMSWGLLPAWAKGPAAKPQINARAETLADKPFFREAFRWRRALIPADGWYEWPKKGADKSPRYFALKDGELFSFAGLWEPGNYAVITVEANPAVARFHDRMPAILPADAEAEWLDPKTKPERAAELLRPYPSDRLSIHAVSPRVGTVAVDEPGLLAPATDSQGELF